MLCSNILNPHMIYLYYAKRSGVEVGDPIVHDQIRKVIGDMVPDTAVSVEPEPTMSYLPPSVRRVVAKHMSPMLQLPR
jgi:hypothetical protein